MIPKSKSKNGYTADEIKRICKDRKIKLKDFNIAIGVNTGIIENGKLLTYKCDIEKALWNLKHKDGKFHTWD